MKVRLDQALTKLKLVSTRSQAESFIRMGMVQVDGKPVLKPGHFVSDEQKIRVIASTQYVSRAAYKLESVAKDFKLDFRDKVILDVGSSTGGFTDFALQHGAKKAVCVEVGTNQLHAKLRIDDRVELHEKTNILEVRSKNLEVRINSRERVEIDVPDIVLIDVSFVSLRDILPHIAERILASKFQLLYSPLVVAMAKPQFEAGEKLKNNGVIKNEKLRREILSSLEQSFKKHFIVLDKKDSGVSGEKGNQERFYLLRLGKSSPTKSRAFLPAR